MDWDHSLNQLSEIARRPQGNDASMRLKVELLIRGLKRKAMDSRVHYKLSELEASMKSLLSGKVILQYSGSAALRGHIANDVAIIRSLLKRCSCAMR